MAKYTKLSISVPTDLLLLARNSRLQAPDEPMSGFIARILHEALIRHEQESYAQYPPTPDDEALSEAWLRASVQDLQGDEPANHPARPTRSRRRARVA
ncbi:MAG TPA: hypothetical protein VGK33_13635 [Chloroflexota bacterium]